MRRFDLFEYLGHKDDQDVTLYRCGYYIINRYCNKINSIGISDTFYTILDNILLKVNMMQRSNIQYFNVYKLKTLTNSQLEKIGWITLNLEDIQEELVDFIMDIDSYDPCRCGIEIFPEKMK